MHLLLALALHLPLAHAEAEGYRMNDLGGTVHLPEGWSSTEWADWELKAKNEAGMLFKLWLTPYQVEPSTETVEVWAERYRRQLEREGVTSVTITSKTVAQVAGRKTARVELGFDIKGAGPGQATVLSFASHGQSVHLRTLAAKRRSAKATAALEGIYETLELDKGPAEVQVGRLETAAGFAATVPEGWRAPVTKELEAVREISGKVGESALAADDCWTAIRPPAQGDPDLIFACRSHFYIGPLDEHSAEGVERELHERFFGRAQQEVPLGEAVQAGDRLAMYFRPPVAERPTRLALAPYDGGLMMMWGMGGNLDQTGLDAAMMQTLSTVEYTGSGGGQPIIGFDKWVSYYLSYRTFSPMVICPALGALGLFGSIFALARRKKDYDLD